MKLFDFNDPFYKPLWIRVAVVSVAVCWGLFEYVSGAQLWAFLFWALAALAFHGLFINFRPREPKDETIAED